MDNLHSWTQTWGPNGEAIAFNPLTPHSDMVNIEGIAHALSNQCRFAGHVKEFLSVAQHSVIVSNLCNKEDALWGLLHDASEAYLVDIPQPLKRSVEFAFYHPLETAIMEAVCRKFNLPYHTPESVKEADLYCLAWEVRDNLQPKIEKIWLPLPEVDSPTLTPIGPKEAEKLFLDRFRSLTNERR